MKLHVYLVLNHLPEAHPSFVQILQEIRQLFRFNLTVINNGQPFAFKRLFHQLGLTCKLHDYPIRFHPAQILREHLQKPPVADAFLWLEDKTLWHPGQLKSWFEQIPNWDWIMPRILPGNTLPQTRQIYQIQAISAPTEPSCLQSVLPEFFPACFFFQKKAIPVIKEWLRSEGQLPLLMMAACDTHSPAWHPRQASEPTQTEFALSIDDALARWQSINEPDCSPERQHVLLESLLRLAPDSPLVYMRLAPLLSATEAISLLESALQRNLVYPEILSLLAYAFRACAKQDLANWLFNYLQQVFSGFMTLSNPWSENAVQSVANISFNASVLPRFSSLSLVILWLDSQDITLCLESLQSLQTSEILLVRLHPLDPLPLTLPSNIKLRHVVWPGSFAALLNTILDDIRSEWVLVLQAHERLSADAIPQIHRLLGSHALGIPCLNLQLHRLNKPFADYISYAPRLFMNHPMLRYQGAVPDNLIYQGPGDFQIQTLSQIKIQEYRNSDVYESELFSFEHIEHEHLKPDVTLWNLSLCLQRGDFQGALDRGQALLGSAFFDSYSQIEQALLIVDCLQAFYELENAVSGLDFAKAHEKKALIHPSYWYLRACFHQNLEQIREAIDCFERCLEFKHQVLSDLKRYRVEHIEVQPLKHLIDLYRFGALSPRQEPRQRQEWIKKWQASLVHLLALNPMQSDQNYYLQLAEASWLAHKLLREPSALKLYQNSLMIDPHISNDAYYAETALIYLEGSLEPLLERLPPQYPYELIRDLQLQPSNLHAFCQDLWRQPELDGPLLANSLLRMAALAFQDISLWLLLSHLCLQQQQLDEAKDVLLIAHHQLPQNPYLLCQLSQLALQTDDLIAAQKYLEQAALLNPELEEVQELWRHMRLLKNDLG